MMLVNGKSTEGRRTVKAVRFVRKMRGGSQPHMIEAEDGRFYVVKFRENPQHRRVLVNEWIATGLMRALNINTPEAALIEITQEFLDANPGVNISRPTGITQPAAGLHYGSLVPVDPEKSAIYDTLPSLCLKNLSNNSDFIGAFVIDMWLGNRDSRQAVFTRATVNGMTKYTAHMIDHGFSFDGAAWTLRNSKLAPLYFNTEVYEPCWSRDILEHWLSRLNELSEDRIRSIAASVPEEWLEEDREELDSMISTLIERRNLLAQLLDNVVTLGLMPEMKIRRRPMGRAERSMSAVAAAR